ncbi:hypothetical protein [Maribacter sp. MMG018]|nr:hypothetical protein [Maribacter sp. MMG018]
MENLVPLVNWSYGIVIIGVFVAVVVILILVLVSMMNSGKKKE